MSAGELNAVVPGSSRPPTKLEPVTRSVSALESDWTLRPTTPADAPAPVAGLRKKARESVESNKASSISARPDAPSVGAATRPAVRKQNLFGKADSAHPLERVWAAEEEKGELGVAGGECDTLVEPRLRKIVWSIIAAKKAAHKWRGYTARARRTLLHKQVDRFFEQYGQSKFRLASVGSGQVAPAWRWVVYFMAGLYIILAAFINLLYAITFPDYVAFGWVGSSGVSLVEHILVSDPVKIAVVVAVFLFVRSAFDRRERNRVLR